MCILLPFVAWCWGLTQQTDTWTPRLLTLHACVRFLWISVLEEQSAPGSLSLHNLLILLCWSQSSLGVWRTGACTNTVPGKWAGGQTTSAVPPGIAAIAYPVCSQTGCSAWHIAVCLLLHLPLGSQAGWKPCKSIISLSHAQQFLVQSIGCFGLNCRLSFVCSGSLKREKQNWRLSSLSKVCSLSKVRSY